MSQLLNSQLTLKALEATGRAIARGGGKGTIRIVVVGGTAGLLAGLLRPTRTTGDCDVMWSGAEEEWERLAAAAADVAGELQLPATWLNRDCRHFAWCLPVGWQRRCEPVGRFGALEVERIGRKDLIAGKVVSCPTRPQDLEDLRDIRPTREELDFAEENIDRLEAEHLDRREYGIERAILAELRAAL